MNSSALALRRVALPAALLLVSASFAAAQPIVPVGSEFQVNEFTTGTQLLPAISWDGDGFVVVWESPGADGDAASVAARRLDASGVPVGGEFVVNSWTTGPQGEPAVASDEEGAFTAVWTNGAPTPGDSNLGIDLRQFDSAGVPLTSDQQVNTLTASNQEDPQLARGTSGDFIVVWTDNSPGDGLEDVRGRVVTSAGVPVGNDFRVHSTTSGRQRDPRISTDGGDGFVVVWTMDESSLPGTDSSDIFARRLDSMGQSVGADFQVNTYTGNRQFNPTVADDEQGGFVVAWTSYQYGDGPVVARGFASDGTPRGPDATVSAPGVVAFDTASTSDARGGVLLVAEEDDPMSNHLFARRVDASGEPVGSQFTVDSEGSNPALAAGAADDFVVTWTSNTSAGTDTSSTSIQARRFAFDDDEDGTGNPVDTCTDTDDDGFGNPGYPANTCADDNCPDDPNTGQEDEDADGLGDVCDACFGDNSTGDSDGDGVCDDQDLCLGDDAGGDADGDGLCAGSPFECDDMDPTNACAAVFEDGFESGDTTAWSSTVN